MMGRPPKPMTPDERALLEAFFAGGADDLTTRKAMGILRDLWPEYVEASRNRRDAVVRRELIRTRFELLTHPRMRDAPPNPRTRMSRPYSSTEAIEKLANETGLTPGYIANLVRPTATDLKTNRSEQEAKKRADLLAAKNNWHRDLCSRYVELVESNLHQEPKETLNSLTRKLVKARETALSVLSVEAKTNQQNLVEIVAGADQQLQRRLRTNLPNRA